MGMLFGEESESPMSLCRHLCAAGLLNYTGGEGAFIHVVKGPAFWINTKYSICHIKQKQSPVP